MENKRIYFISDLHLGALALEDSRATELRVVRWLDTIRPTAKALYLMGDILDYWYEYKYVVPRGHVRFLGKLAQLADEGVEIHWFTGNHDIWIFDYLPNEIGLKLHTKSIITQLYGRSLYLGHGDKDGDKSAGFKFIQGIFHNKLCQKLYATIHPRWSVQFANLWSLRSRKTSKENPLKLDTTKNTLVAFAEKYNAESAQKVDYFIFGHQHIALSHKLNSGGEITILGDWINLFTYAQLSPDGTLELKYYKE